MYRTNQLTELSVVKEDEWTFMDSIRWLFGSRDAILVKKRKPIAERNYQIGMEKENKRIIAFYMQKRYDAIEYSLHNKDYWLIEVPPDLRLYDKAIKKAFMDDSYSIFVHPNCFGFYVTLPGVMPTKDKGWILEQNV